MLRHDGDAQALEEWRLGLLASGRTVRYLHGRAAQTKPALFEQLRTACQLPLWLGVTWDGLYDVLIGGAPGLAIEDGFDLVLLDAHEVLGAEPEPERARQRGLLREVLLDVAAAWADASDGGARTRGPADVRVHLLLPGGPSLSGQRGPADG